MIDCNDLEEIAKERQNECFLKGSGVLKLIGGIRTLEKQNSILHTSPRLDRLEEFAAITEKEAKYASESMTKIALLEKFRKIRAALNDLKGAAIAQSAAKVKK